MTASGDTVAPNSLVAASEMTPLARRRCRRAYSDRRLPQARVYRAPAARALQRLLGFGALPAAVGVHLVVTVWSSGVLAGHQKLGAHEVGE